MNILMLTAGTGSFHCGTCHRDDTLAHALRDLGHSVALVPLYLPLITDREGASAGQPVRLGGVSAYLLQSSSFFRSLPSWMQTLLDSRAILSLAARQSGSTDPSSLGPMTLSMLAGQDGRQRKAIERLTDVLTRLDPRPDVVLLSNALLLGLAAPVRAALEVPMVCTLQGEDVFVDALPETHREAAWTLMTERVRSVDRYIAVSAFYAAEMQRRLNLDEATVSVAHNGIDLSGYTTAEAPPQRPTIGFLGRLCNAKGLGRVVEAYIALRSQWDGLAPTLCLGGTLTAIDRPDLGAACRRLAEAGMNDQLQIQPNMSLDEKQAFLRGLTVLCVPPLINESFGLTSIEALASGVPVVAVDRGALAEVLNATGGGVVVGEDTPEALADALAGVLRDPARRENLGQTGQDGVCERFNANRMARDVATILQAVAA